MLSCTCGGLFGMQKMNTHHVHATLSANFWICSTPPFTYASVATAPSQLCVATWQLTCMLGVQDLLLKGSDLKNRKERIVVLGTGW